jgi:hypothetical protein
MTSKMRITTTPTGPDMQVRLRQVGIEAQKVVRQRETGFYIADFYVPGMEMPIRPSQDWAYIIQQRLPDLTVIDTSDTVAGWRSDKPVIWASVTFVMRPSDLPRPAARPTSPRWMDG